MTIVFEGKSKKLSIIASGSDIFIGRSVDGTVGLIILDIVTPPHHYLTIRSTSVFNDFVYQL